MTYIAKPALRHPALQKNRVGYTRRDYEGKVSTLGMRPCTVLKPCEAPRK